MQYAKNTLLYIINREIQKIWRESNKTIFQIFRMLPDLNSRIILQGFLRKPIFCKPPPPLEKETEKGKKIVNQMHLPVHFILIPKLVHTHLAASYSSYKDSYNNKNMHLHN